MLEACYGSARDVYAEAAAQSSDFAALYKSFRAFRSDSYLFWQVTDLGFDAFNAQHREL